MFEQQNAFCRQTARRYGYGVGAAAKSREMRRMAGKRAKLRQETQNIWENHARL
jgi:hypothetical protein